MCDIVVVVNILDCQMQHHKPLHPSPPHLRRSTLHFLLPIWVYKVRFGSFDIQLKLAFRYSKGMVYGHKKKQHQ